MAYHVVSGEIENNVLYHVSGGQSVIYNAAVYITGQYFRGVAGIRVFTYSGGGTQELNEVPEIKGGAVELDNTSTDLPATFNETVKLSGSSVEFELSEGDKVVHEVTKIQGFAFELIDYPFYSFEIIETRL